VQSYYQASRNKEIEQSPLTEDVLADICVIGGGIQVYQLLFILLKKVSM